MAKSTDADKPRCPKSLSDYQQSLVSGRELADKYLSILLQSGQDMHVALTHYCNDGILHEVAVSDFTDHLTKLIEAGVDPCRKGMDNRTALFGAAKHGKTQACAILLQAGVDPDEPDKVGLTPRKIARSRGHLDVLALFEAQAAMSRINQIRSCAVSP